MTTTDPAELDEQQKRIRELEEQVASARAAEQMERDRREAAELSRDQWVSIARGKPWTAGQSRLFGDPQLAIDAAYADGARARRRLDELQSLVLRRDQTVDGLVRLVRLLPKLPVSVKKLHPDTALAVRWALSDRVDGMFDQPVMAAATLVELDGVAEEWEAVRRYSMAQVEASRG